MGMRLSIVAVLAVLVGCKATGESKMGSGSKRATAEVEMEGRDAVERAILSLGIEGSLLPIDLGRAASRHRKDALRIAQVHLLDDLILLESADEKPSIYALERNGLGSAWVSELLEPSLFPATENRDTVLVVTANYFHAFRSLTGEPAMEFVGGPLDGHKRPPLELHFTPTGSAAAQQDTAYLPSMGSPRNNKTLESFSLVSGQNGWGYRTIGDLVTAPIVGGAAGDPKLYMATDTGVVTCIEAETYAYDPRANWEVRLDAGSSLPMCLTADTKTENGALYIVDREGQIYCLDRITGERRWTHSTSRKPMDPPMVFGNYLCVRMRSGLCVFDRRNVLYSLMVVTGPDEGKTFWVRSGKVNTLGNDAKADIRLSDPRAGGLSFEIQGEVLAAMTSGKGVEVDGRKATGRVVLHGGQKLKVGGSTLLVEDRRTDPLLADLPYDRAVARVGERLIVAKGNALTILDVWTGETVAGPVTIPGARFIPSNAGDSNLYVVAGDARVYALFPR